MSDPRTLPLMTDPHSTLLFRWSFVLAIFQIIIMVLIIMTLMASNESISLTLLYEEPENRELDRRSINVLTLNCSYSCHHFNFSWVYDVIWAFLGKKLNSNGLKVSCEFHRWLKTWISRIILNNRFYGGLLQYYPFDKYHTHSSLPVFQWFINSQLNVCNVYIWPLDLRYQRITLIVI